jgi:hypothetical protein
MKPCATRAGISTQSSAASSAGLDEGHLGALEQRPGVDQRHEGPARADDPPIQLPSMEMETPDDTRYRARQIALDERGIDASEAPASAGSIRPTVDARHSSRNAPRSSA